MLEPRNCSKTLARFLDAPPERLYECNIGIAAAEKSIHDCVKAPPPTLVYNPLINIPKNWKSEDAEKNPRSDR
jgi:putative ubiquitin-RnfH superfamily antitoxin RatB of RatAB toxin-antitoxin module